MKKNSGEQGSHLLKPKVHWSRATGYLQLGMWTQAKSELEMLPEELPGESRKEACWWKYFNMKRPGIK